jgi:putative transcriptional regulator
MPGVHTFFPKMREFPSSLGLSGSLLIAHPNLIDPNFRRSVLIISASDPQEGSFGLIVNRATEKTVAELLPEHELGTLGELPVFIGGPVSRDQLTFVAFQWVDDVLRIRTHLLLEEAREMVAEGGGVVRAFLGYAGWSKGQLEEELEKKAWLVQKPDQEVMDTDRCVELWPTIMRDQGPWFRLLAAAPDDPSLN